MNNTATLEAPRTTPTSDALLAMTAGMTPEGRALAVLDACRTALFAAADEAYALDHARGRDIEGKAIEVEDLLSA
jgi:hypothetical protein